MEATSAQLLLRVSCVGSELQKQALTAASMLSSRMLTQMLADPVLGCSKTRLSTCLRLQNQAVTVETPVALQ